MLTGDKVETAKCISVMAGIKSNNQDFYEISEPLDELSILKKLREFSHAAKNKILLIDGGALTVILETNPELFIKTAIRSAGVVCARCHPRQKSKIATYL